MDALNSYPICSLIASMIFWLVSIETFRWFFDLTHYRPTSMSRANSGRQKPRARFQARGFSSGDVLLSHNLSSHYHRGCSVSLPCSEWERVVPLRYYHQNLAPRTALSSGGLQILDCRLKIARLPIFNLRSAFCNPTDSLTSTYRKY